MTVESAQRGNPERLETSVVDLIVVMRRLTGLLNSSAGSLLDGTLTPTGEWCLAQLKTTAADLAETEPVSLDDLAAVTAFAKAHCTIGVEAARNFDPLAAADHVEIAITLLAKASEQLETMTGRSADEIGPAQRLH